MTTQTTFYKKHELNRKAIIENKDLLHFVDGSITIGNERYQPTQETYSEAWSSAGFAYYYVKVS
jgi:hypothetical protein